MNLKPGDLVLTPKNMFYFQLKKIELYDQYVGVCGLAMFKDGDLTTSTYILNALVLVSRKVKQVG